MIASKHQTLQILHTWVISLRILQQNYMNTIFVKLYLVLYNLVIGNVRLGTSNEIREKTDKSLVYVFNNQF